MTTVLVALTGCNGGELSREEALAHILASAAASDDVVLPEDVTPRGKEWDCVLASGLGGPNRTFHAREASKYNRGGDVPKWAACTRKWGEVKAIVRDSETSRTAEIDYWYDDRTPFGECYRNYCPPGVRTMHLSFERTDAGWRLGPAMEVPHPQVVDLPPLASPPPSPADPPAQ